ncbi:hypothetical protein [Vibrio astriarenae]|uniref:hypothetical protein n=1 Tax=Vibrio astriarenae TaxID=1481923 RepID=UPI003734C55B
MLSDILIQSIGQFQQDCSKLCERNYPAIHNRGMTEHHMALAFTRRLSRTLSEYSHTSTTAPLDMLPRRDLPHHFRVSCELGSVWIVTQHMMNASKTYRRKLMKDIAQWKSEFGFAIQPNDLLLVLADHWLTRSQSSRELIHWWTGVMPDEMVKYQSQGISLYESDSQLSQTVEQHFSMSPYYLKIAHPLKRVADEELVRKYVQLYAVIECNG